MKKNKLLPVYILAILGLLLLAWVGVFLKGQKEQLAPRTGPVIESVYGLGTMIAPKVYRVKTGVSMSITHLYVREGDKVLSGAPLVRFDEMGIVNAPHSGTVTEVVFKEGELVFPQVAVLTLTSLDDLYLEVSLEQQSVLRIQRGQKAVASFESLRNERIEGTVTSIYPRGNQFIVRIDIPKLPSGVLPGMTADVAIETGRKDKVLSIPLRAIIGGKVIRLRQGKRESVSVRLGVVDSEWGEVVSNNIEPDDELLVRKR